jgi:hypothetical protein
MVASVVASACAFAAQVLAGRLLHDVEVARLTSWTVSVGLWCIPGVTLQYFVSLSRRQMPLERPVLAICAGASALTFMAICLSFRTLPTGSLIAITFVAQIAFGVLVGRLQATSQILALGHITIALAVARIGIPLALGRSLAAWQAGLPLIVLAGVLGALYMVWRSVPGEAAPISAGEAPPNADRVQRAAGSVLLTGASVLLPFLDFKLIAWTQSEMQAGQFARASTLGRILYFGGSILVQTIYPLQLKLARGDGAPALARFVRHANVLVVAALGIGTAVLSVGAPRLVPILFAHELGIPASAVLVSCINYSLLVLLFSSLQAAIATLSLRGPLATAVCLVAGIGGIAWFAAGWEPLAVLIAGGVLYASALLLGKAVAQRAKPQHEPRTP